eukprot:1159990-Pelagomonas_calceolata.AAC.8
MHAHSSAGVTSFGHKDTAMRKPKCVLHAFILASKHRRSNKLVARPMSAPPHAFTMAEKS